MKRGSVRKKESKFLGAWLPDDLVDLMDRAVTDSDTDRSKFVRMAIKEKLARHGFVPVARS
jgi:metal-responsive CopG/Arc/MetJ family transcriptional regulator